MTTPATPDFSDASKWRTRDGRPVRIYCTDAGGEFPIHGAVPEGDIWLNISWTVLGTKFRCRYDGKNDLIPAPPERKRLTLWLNIYPNTVDVHVSLAMARKWLANGCECRRKIEIEYTLGEGLDGADESGKECGK